jgi:hypothetical protein
VEPARPLVRIIADRRGALIDPFDCALDDAQAASGRSVIRCLDPASLNVDIDDFF